MSKNKKRLPPEILEAAKRHRENLKSGLYNDPELYKNSLIALKSIISEHSRSTKSEKLSEEFSPEELHMSFYPTRESQEFSTDPVMKSNMILRKYYKLEEPEEKDIILNVDENIIRFPASELSKKNLIDIQTRPTKLEHEIIMAKEKFRIENIERLSLFLGFEFNEYLKKCKEKNLDYDICLKSTYKLFVKFMNFVYEKIYTFDPKVFTDSYEGVLPLLDNEDNLQLGEDRIMEINPRDFERVIASLMVLKASHPDLVDFNTWFEAFQADNRES